MAANHEEVGNNHILPISRKWRKSRYSEEKLDNER